MKEWLILQGALEYVKTYSDIDITADDRALFAADRSDTGSNTSGSVAVIPVKGVLTAQRDIFAFLFGGGNTTYASIIEGLTAAEHDEDIESVVLDINSPGGTVDGMFDAMAAIEAFSKPIEARVSSKAASAAFILATQADRIVATSPAAEFGSLGVAFETFIDNDRVTITNTKSPDKRPDMATEEGQQVVRDRLDGIFDLFADLVADGRGVSVKKVNSDFGKGRMFLAEESVKRGMIDELVTTSQPTGVGGKSTKEGKKAMDLKTLHASHPDVYAEAVKIGVDQERDRVGAHLLMGDTSGDMDTAVKAIGDGSEMTALLNATYMAAGMRRNAIDDRQADSDDSDAGDAAAAGGTEATAADKVADLVCEQMGVTD